MEENCSRHNQILKILKIEIKAIFLLSIIFLGALLIRFYFVPYGLPVNFDAFSGYFLYALDISILGHLPNYTLSQSGWSEFLSLFFMNFQSDRLIDYMNLQRTISVIISGLTVIPIYYICRKFFNAYFSLIGAIIFALDPRIIINSTLGISEPLYILAISLGILFFLNLNKKIIYLSFGFFAWATIIRPEGQFWFIAFAIAYFVRFRKNYKDLGMFLICLLIFVLVLSPIVIHRIQCCENDAIIGRILVEISNYSNNPTQSNDQLNLKSYGPDFFSGIKLFGWALIPILIIFVPVGFFSILRQFSYPNYLLIITSVVLSLPIIYSVSIAPDTRYVYPLFPILCVISLFGIKSILSNFKNKKLISGVIISIIVISSILFLDFSKIKYEESDEAYNISKIIINDVYGVNKSSKVVEFFKVAEIEKKWSSSEYSGNLRNNYDIVRFSEYDFNDLYEFISFHKDKKLTHIVIDENENMPEYMKDVLNDEAKYQYLIKEFDSTEHGYKYVVKSYKIDYENFEKLKR
ncbi:ArnT family glycosyltransferase [Nitrosopumilus adriaticus]|uniref:ArnT family glycosyltransferase n=1 Tax=Nitrosopumilus adriaticus TaxID=1580092 RepID=UPI00352BFFB5